MIIIYPNDGWNSFVSSTTASLFMDVQLNNAAWESMDAVKQDALLTQTALQIKLCDGINLPEDNTNDLQVAQLYLILQASNTDMTAYDANQKAITKEKVDGLEVTYDSAYKANNNSSFNPITTSLLKQYGCINKSGGFSQSYVGRS